MQQCGTAYHTRLSNERSNRATYNVLHNGAAVGTAKITLYLTLVDDSCILRGGRSSQCDFRPAKRNLWILVFSYTLKSKFYRGRSHLLVMTSML